MNNRGMYHDPNDPNNGATGLIIGPRPRRELQAGTVVLIPVRVKYQDQYGHDKFVRVHYEFPAQYPEKLAETIQQIAATPGFYVDAYSPRQDRDGYPRRDWNDNGNGNGFPRRRRFYPNGGGHYPPGGHYPQGSY